MPSAHIFPSPTRFFLTIFFLGFWVGTSATPLSAQNTPSNEKKLIEQPTLQRPARFRGGTCWLAYKNLREDLKRYRALSPRLNTYHCEEEAERWQRCRGGEEDDACQKDLHQKRWLACFRIRRRMRVITARLEALVTLQKKQRCRWKLKLPKERFSKQLFATPTSSKR